MTILWRSVAEDKFLATLDHLTTNFSLEAAIDLDDLVTKCVEFIANGIMSGIYSEELRAYKFTIKKYNILVYQKEQDLLYIIDFIASRTDHNLNQ